MIGYPNAKKTSKTEVHTEKKHSTANRGMTLEYDLNMTNQYYLSIDKAVVHKVPTPIQVVKVDYPARTAAKITEAYYRIPSTTDYHGIYRGKALDFEAKEIKSKTSFPFQLIHKHQFDHLARCIRHGGIAFLIIRFTSYDETYLIDAHAVIQTYEKKERASLPYQWIKENGFLIPFGYGGRVDYLKVVDSYYFNGGKENG